MLALMYEHSRLDISKDVHWVRERGWIYLWRVPEAIDQTRADLSDVLQAKYRWLDSS
ncbi:MAG: hypothetical protein WAV40_01230 [Microgenomates group bacterium]